MILKDRLYVLKEKLVPCPSREAGSLSSESFKSYIVSTSPALEMLKARPAVEHRSAKHDSCQVLSCDH